MDRYFKNDPCHIATEVDPVTNQIAGTRLVVTSPLPAEIPLIIGDCVQNLRTALDYLVWELVLAANNTPGKKNAFPVCASPESFKKDIGRGLLLGAADVAIAEIESIQPYHGGNNPEVAVLWVLNQLTNINKHRRLLITLLNPGFSRDPRIFEIAYGDTVITPDPVRRDTDIVVTSRAGKMSVDACAVVNIVINEGRLKDREVASVMATMIRWAETKAIPRFEKFFN